MGGFVFLGLLAIITVLFVTPLILGFYVVGQRGGLRALQGYIGFIFLLVLGVLVFGIVAVFANVSQAETFMAAAQLR